MPFLVLERLLLLLIFLKCSVQQQAWMLCIMLAAIPVCDYILSAHWTEMKDCHIRPLLWSHIAKQWIGISWLPSVQYDAQQWTVYYLNADLYCAILSQYLLHSGLSLQLLPQQIIWKYKVQNNASRISLLYFTLMNWGACLKILAHFQADVFGYIKIFLFAASCHYKAACYWQIEWVIGCLESHYPHVCLYCVLAQIHLYYTSSVRWPINVSPCNR